MIPRSTTLIGSSGSRTSFSADQSASVPGSTTGPGGRSRPPDGPSAAPAAVDEADGSDEDDAPAGLTPPTSAPANRGSDARSPRTARSSDPSPSNAGRPRPT